jgi:hypothetical protein
MLYCNPCTEDFLGGNIGHEIVICCTAFGHSNIGACRCT